MARWHGPVEAAKSTFFAITRWMERDENALEHQRQPVCARAPCTASACISESPFVNFRITLGPDRMRGSDSLCLGFARAFRVPGDKCARAHCAYMYRIEIKFLPLGIFLSDT